MTPTCYRGLPVSEGLASGQLYVADPPLSREPGTGSSSEDVRDAFAAVAQERNALAAQLHERGRADQAEIVGIGALIAADPALVDPAAAAAEVLAALDNADLAARADDVRQVANAVLAQLAGGGGLPPPPATSFILVRREVDPADLIRFAEAGLVGAVSVTGGASSHAAIIARGLGVPMLAGADPGVLRAPAGHRAILDAVGGRLTVDPAPEELAAVAGLSAAGVPPAAEANGSHSSASRDDASAGLAAATPRTADGQPVTLLCNVASAAETRLGLARGAAGVGLLRTEIPFVKAGGWPTEAEHTAALDPVLSLLTGRPAVVRLLDFSGDKIPPFLAGGQAGLDPG